MELGARLRGGLAMQRVGTALKREGRVAQVCAYAGPRRKGSLLAKTVGLVRNTRGGEGACLAAAVFGVPGWLARP